MPIDIKEFCTQQNLIAVSKVLTDNNYCIKNHFSFWKLQQ